MPIPVSGSEANHPTGVSEVSPTKALYSNLNRRVIPGLNGLRAVAAFAVVFYHFNQHRNLKMWLFPGPYGVICFFVLSGFLITWLLLKERDNRGEVSLTRFWMRRALRILPAFYAYWLVQAALIGRAPVDFVAAALYFYNYYQGFAHQWIAGVMAHTWSLAVEEQFYLFWPFVFVLVRSRPRLKRYLVVAILVVQLARPVASYFLPEWYVYEAFEFRCDALMIGCLLALMLRDRATLPAWIFSPAVTTAALLTFPIMMKGNSQHVFAVIGNTATAYASAILILQAIRYSPRILENRLMIYMGSISYPIYLYHGLFLDVIDHHVNWSLPAQLAVYAGGTVLAASASYYLVEKPFLRLKR